MHRSNLLKYQSLPGPMVRGAEDGPAIYKELCARKGPSGEAAEVGLLRYVWKEELQETEQ